MAIEEKNQFQKARHELFMEICKLLRIPQIVDWLSKRLK